MIAEVSRRLAVPVDELCRKIRGMQNFMRRSWSILQLNSEYRRRLTCYKCRRVRDSLIKHCSHCNRTFHLSCFSNTCEQMSGDKWTLICKFCSEEGVKYESS